MGAFMISMPTLALVNNGLKFCINQFRLGLRYRLSVMLYNKYIEGKLKEKMNTMFLITKLSYFCIQV